MLMLNILGIHNDNNNNFEGDFLEEKSKKELKGEQGAEIRGKWNEKAQPMLNISLMMFLMNCNNCQGINM